MLHKISQYLIITILTILFSCGAVYGATILFPYQGGTGTGIKPTAGQILVGQSDGRYLPQSTSSLGIFNYWQDDGTYLSPVTSTRTLTIPSLPAGECVQVGAGGMLTGAGASCATTSSAPEADPIFMASSSSLPYVKNESDPVFTAVSTTYLTTTTASSTYFKISDWLLQTTDNLVEGVTNLYFTIARARNSISSLIPAITYSTSTGQFSLTSGYEIPLSASTTNWNNTYNIVNSSSTFWDIAYSWGNHALAGYLTTISGLNISLLNNDVGYITTTPAETDPIWSSASTSVAYLANNQSFTGFNVFENATTTFGTGTDTFSISNLSALGGALTGKELSGTTNLGLDLFSIKNGIFLRGADGSPSITMGTSDFATTSVISFDDENDFIKFEDSEIETPTGNSNQWNLAYSWGDHSSVGYLTNLLGGLNAILGNATATTFSSDNIYLPSVTNSYLGTDANGKIVATSTPIPVESDPIFMSASSSFAKLSVNNNFTGVENTFNNININAGNYLKYNGENVLIASTTLYSYFFAGSGNTSSTGINNYGFGSSALSQNATGSYNNAIGTLALGSNTSGSFNNALGSGSLLSNTIGSNLIAIGNDSLRSNISGQSSIGIGLRALYSQTVGGQNVCIGEDCLYNTNYLSVGVPSQENTAIGYKAGYYNIGSRNVFIGNEADVLVNASGTTDSIAIGNDIKVGANFTTAVGGQNNNVIGVGSGLFGGQNNTNSGLYSNIFGGQYHYINNSAVYSSIVGGQYNTSTGDRSIISGGQYNNNAGDRSGITSGQYNTILPGATDSFIAGGVGNIIGTTGYYTNIIGGLYSYASDFGSTVIGSIYATSTNSGIIMNSQNASADGFGAMILSSLGATVVGVCTGIIESDYVTVVADYSLMLDSMFSTIQTLTGNATTTKAFMANSMYSNITTSTATLITSNYSNLVGIGSVIIGGEYNNVTGTNSFAMGSGINITGNRSFGINLAPSTSPMTISNNNVLSVMGGNVGIGTTSPAFVLSVASTTNWLQLSNGIQGFNFTWETSTIDYPLISGLASSTDFLGGDLPLVALKDRAVIVGDDEPSISFSVFTDILTKIATIAFDTANEIIKFSGAKAYQWYDYATSETPFVKFDAENLLSLFGDLTGNYTKFESDGTMEAVGDAMAWEDINIGFATLGAGATAPDPINLGTSTIRIVGFDGNAITESKSGCVEIPHNAATTTDIYPHIHWLPTTNNTGVVKWNIQYSWLINGNVATFATTTATSSASGVAWTPVLTSFPAITSIERDVGSQFCFKVERNPTDSDDTYPDDAGAITIGLHYQVNMLGSRTLTDK